MKKPELCDHFYLHGKRFDIKKHPTDFAIIKNIRKARKDVRQGLRKIRDGLMSLLPPPPPPILTLKSMIQKAVGDNLEELMNDAKKDVDCLVSHLFQLGTGEDILFNDKIILDLEKEDEKFINSILKDYDLEFVRRMGHQHVLRLPKECDLDVMELANMLYDTSGVKACSPGIMVKVEAHAELYPGQWNLNARNMKRKDLLPDADIGMENAWELSKGNPDTIVAIIDDGFDLGHPALKDVKIHKEALNYSDGSNNVQARDNNFHGTSVAALALAQHEGSAIRGIAPDCTFLPIRIEFGYLSIDDYLELFQYASERADVLNCSFGPGPSSYDPFPSGFRVEVETLTKKGGRKGNGLVMVFSAGNDDAPTSMSKKQNVNGVKMFKAGKIAEIPAGHDIFSGYPLCNGVVTAGAMTSLKRKAGYSNFGPEITVTAPSGNYHIIPVVCPPDTPGRESFAAKYPGPALLSAINRPGHGVSTIEFTNHDPDFKVETVNEIYTLSFSGTSAAAPTVTAVAALMLSVNGNLTAEQVLQILEETADKNLDAKLDNTKDPNIQGLSGEFKEGRSLFFGAGKINAEKAVARAKELLKQ
ncbi:MAG: S8 family serine peptidase [bacterium]|nr:S8 family serine peptidase [bacterium]